MWLHCCHYRGRGCYSRFALTSVESICQSFCLSVQPSVSFFPSMHPCGEWDLQPLVHSPLPPLNTQTIGLGTQRLRAMTFDFSVDVGSWNFFFFFLSFIVLWYTVCRNYKSVPRTKWASETTGDLHHSLSCFHQHPAAAAVFVVDFNT